MLFSWRTAAWSHVSAGVNSWQAGLALGFLHHLQWGPQVVFTFGPYGFVEDILPFSRLTAGLAIAYTFAVMWGLAALIISALRKPWGLLPAALVTWAALSIGANLLEAPELALATALGLALASFRATTSTSRSLLLAALGGLAGFQLLVEINVGLVTTALMVLAVVGGKSRRAQDALAAVVPFALVPVVALLAVGQSLGNFASYVRGSLSVALGYGSAMSLSTGRSAEDWFAVVDVVLLVLLFALALRGRPWLEAAAISLMLVGWLWEAAKEGFVRHDTHDLTFFGLLLLALCLARLPRRLAPVQFGAVVLAAVLACVANGHPTASLRSPARGAGALTREVRDLAAPAQWASLQRGAVEQLRSTGDDLPPALVSELRGHTLAVETLEDGVTFAYPGLSWDPEPVLQSYSAYTSYLDDLDASFLASARAPQRILYRPVTINNRDEFWDTPTALEAMYCHYVSTGVSDHWLVLARVADRCGPRQMIGEDTVRFGQPVKVPLAAGRLVVATFSISSPLLADAEAAVLKPPEVDLTAWEGGSSPTTYRFLEGSADDDHVIVAPTSLGYPAAFAPRPIRQLELGGGGWGPGQGSVHVTFYAVSLRRG
ncbi:MAG TPA: hypothetical protein VEJ84_03480 [Acidimicrobiales bacterium]|nr:hypothetical protein [Acidimicrobiales bacterium]